MIGNFDGVYCGYQVLFVCVCVVVDVCGLFVCVMMFELYLCEFFNLVGVLLCIVMLCDKFEVLCDYGVDCVVVEYFNYIFVSQLLQVFVECMLVNGLYMCWMMVGDDFCYGVKCVGIFDMLKVVGEQYGFEVEQMGMVVGSDGMCIFSFGVCVVFVVGDFDVVVQVFGYGYVISGYVVYGLKFGCDFGFLMLNLLIVYKWLVFVGIFVVQVYGFGFELLLGVVSFGLCLIVDDLGCVLFEVYLFDWYGDVYGKLICVEFLKKLCDEVKFDDFEVLLCVIVLDVVNVCVYFIECDCVLGSCVMGFVMLVID